MRQTLRWMALAMAALATIGRDRATKHVATALLAGEADRSYLAWECSAHLLVSQICRRHKTATITGGVR